MTASPALDDAEFSHTQRARAQRVLIVVAAGTFLTALDVTIVNVAFKTIQQEFDAGPTLSWIISGYAIAFAAGLLTAGRLADGFGRKRTFLTGVAVFGVASVSCGLAVSVAMLIVSRVVQALGAALIVPSATALVMREFPVEHRAAAAGTLASSGGLGAATGPVVGGLVVDAFGWRWIFLIAVPVCVGVLMFGRRILRNATVTTARLPDLLGASLAIATVGILTLALTESDQWGWTSARLVGCLLLCVLLAAGFVTRSRTHANPVLDLALFRMRFVTASIVAGVLYAAGFYSFNFTMIQWLRGVWHYSPTRAGLGAIAAPLGSVWMSPVGGRLAQRFGHNRIAIPGLCLFGVASLAMSELLTERPNYWLRFFPALFAVGIAIGMSISVLSSAASAYLPTSRFAMGSALYATGRQVGGALGIAAVTAISTSSSSTASGLQWSWRFIAVVMVGAALAMAWLFRPPSPAELAAASA